MRYTRDMKLPLRGFLHSMLFVFVVGIALSVANMPYPENGRSATVVHAEPLFVVGTELPRVSARAWILMDMETGEVLAQQDAQEVLPIASVTKLMTARVALDTLAREATTSVDASAVATEGRAGRLEEGEVVKVGELLFPLLLESSNDAAEVLAQVEGRGEFLNAMHEEAQRLGLSTMVFEDPHGISPHNRSSARDLATLLRDIYLHDRHILDITMLPRYVGEHHEWINNDPVYETQGYVGGKHGFTPEAQRTFAGVWKQEFKDGSTRPVGIALLHSDAIPQDVARIRNFAQQSVSYTFER